jgi:3-deoxy-D-manno-octulosonate 8-phosphate phosphatase (KDO 8-P phosphatase)
MSQPPDRCIPPLEQLRRIRCLLTDVDGVLTDGRIHINEAGEESKIFHVHDAAGLVYWHRAGGISGFVSGRCGKMVEKRAQDLSVSEVHLGKLDKLPVLEDILERHEMLAEEVAYVGDDLVDLPVLAAVGFAVTVPNARLEVRERVHYVTETPGGDGALREVVEILLKAQGKWDDLVRRGGRP